MPAADTASAVATPYTDHLWSIGFTLKPKAERLPLPIDDGQGNVFVTGFEITACPERGEARRLFAAKGPSKAEVKSNLPLEHFQIEQEQRRTTLKDLYTEQCARSLFEMLSSVAPTISRPRVV